MKDNENKYSKMPDKSSKVENFSCEECKQKKNHPTPVKLESKKQAKKVIAEREGFGWEVPIDP